jgi:alanine-alpha-ketoisovalerate/valine-pyruvate aminotransferase
MNPILDIINEYHDIIGERQTEMGDAAGMELVRLEEIERVALEVVQAGKGYDGQEYVMLVRKAIAELERVLKENER